MLDNDIVFKKKLGKPEMIFAKDRLIVKDHEYEYRLMKKRKFSKLTGFTFEYNGKSKAFAIDSEYRQQLVYILQMIDDNYPDIAENANTDTTQNIHNNGKKKGCLPIIVVIVIIAIIVYLFVGGDPNLTDEQRQAYDKEMQIDVDSFTSIGETSVETFESYINGNLSAMEAYNKLDELETLLYSKDDLVDSQLKENDWPATDYSDEVKSIATMYWSATKEMKKYINENDLEAFEDLKDDLSTVDYVLDNVEKARNDFLGEDHED